MAQYLMAVPATMTTAAAMPAKRAPSLSRIIPPMMRKNRKTLNQP